MRKALLSILVASLFAPLSVLAQATPTMTVHLDYPDGMPFSRERLTYDQGLDALLEFLNSKRGGTFQMTDAGQLLMQFKVDGEQVQIDSAEGSQTTTMSAVLGNFERARAAGHLAGCQTSLQSLATALGSWAKEHNGHYPDTLAELVPRYLKDMPRCLARPGGDSYAAGYKKRSSPDHFVLQCTVNHAPAGVGYGIPAYDSDFGLIQNETQLHQHFKP